MNFKENKSKILYRLALILAILTSLFIMWANLAVGIINSESDLINLLFFGVIVIGFLGVLISRWRPAGLALTMAIMAILQALAPTIALLIRKPELSSPEAMTGVFAVLGINTFFVISFSVSALLFEWSNLS